VVWRRRQLDRPTWDKLCESTNAPALIAYTVTDDDVRGPFVSEIPRDLEGWPRLSQLGHRSVAELLAEKIPHQRGLIKQLNPDKTVTAPGRFITFPTFADGRPDGQVFRIEVDKPAKAVRAFGRNNEVVAFYPASVGSREKPAPSGTYHVGRLSRPPLSLDPKFQFKACER